MRDILDVKIAAMRIEEVEPPPADKRDSRAWFNVYRHGSVYHAHFSTCMCDHRQSDLGSGLIDQSQKMSAAAMQIAEK